MSERFIDKCMSAVLVCWIFVMTGYAAQLLAEVF